MALDLDKRQRAMLAEMGVRVWLPASQPVAQAVVDAPVAEAPAPVVARAPAPIPERAPALAEAHDVREDVEAFDDAAPAAQEHADASAPALQRAAWLIVGDAAQPGEATDGDPFTGEAGRLLDNMLRAMGLVRGKGVCIATAPLSARQVAQVQPRVILVMGRAAAQSLLRSQEPIGKLRGQVHDVAGVPTVVTYPPAYLLRSLPDKARAWADLCLAMGLMERGAD